MVLCWIALPLFAILGIFSLKYRKLAKDSLECMFKTITLRKCSSGLDDKIRADITGNFMSVSPGFAGFFYKNYKIISWIVVILMLSSLYFSGAGVYNYVKYGNCNGANSDEFCIFDAIGGNGGQTEPVNNSMTTQKLTTFEECQQTYNMSINECLAHCSAK